MADDSPKTKVFALKSSDGEVFEVEETVAFQSQMIKQMFEDLGDSANKVIIPLGNVTAEILAKVIKYCEKHAGDLSVAAKIAFDKEFINVDLTTVGKLAIAANYLEITSLQELTCQYMADCLKNMSVEEAREIFGIEKDFTPMEEAQLWKETSWAFD